MTYDSDQLLRYNFIEATQQVFDLILDGRVEAVLS